MDEFKERLEGAYSTLPVLVTEMEWQFKFTDFIKDKVNEMHHHSKPHQFKVEKWVNCNNKITVINYLRELFIFYVK